MYADSIPFLIHGLKALSGLLKKAEAHCEVKKIDKSVMLGLRLFPDMFPLMRQAQLVTDFSKGCAARLSGQPVPAYPDEEKTFDELQARITKCIGFLESISPASLEEAAKREVTLKIGGQDRTMSGHAYFNAAVLPNYYFHLTTAYNILRHNGVELGKGDFIARS
jgi:uncharacterized protein